MFVSAFLTLLGLALVFIQVAFSDGTRPHIIGLPIGMAPIALAVVLLVLGPVIGLIAGNARFQFASCLALAGSAATAIGIMSIAGQAFLVVGGVTWVLAIFEGARALREPDAEAGRP